MLTLRQIEVIRAIMVTGTIGGAARLLNVSSPGISRVMKHAEGALALKLFSRRNGRYVPTPEAKDIFSQINGVYDKVEDLQYVIARLRRGTDSGLRVGSVPSISNVMVPRAIAAVRRKYPNLLVEIDILKIEEAIDYLLLGKGEVVAMSHKVEHPMLAYEPLATGRLVCVVPEGHALARRAGISATEIVEHPLIGIDPNDPYGRIMAGIFMRNALAYEVSIRARFGSTVCALVRNGLGIAVIDEFSVVDGNVPGIVAIPIVEPTAFETCVAFRKDATLSSYCEFFIAALRGEMARAGAASRRRAAVGRKK
ncbi:MAG: LysR family transcriptional regulator [Xanthobacteraceae bacterium]|nr:LysR family transcriptional regulator [Xanthobacteraceae bacterium]